MQDRLSAVRSGLPGARWTDGARMHITLRFIGEVERRAAEDIDAAFSGIDAPAFQVRIRGLGGFEKGGRVHTLYARAEPDPALLHLHGKVESAAVRAGVPAGRRKFKPHVTLARLRRADAARAAAALQAGGDFDPGAFDADSFILYRSHLGAEKPVYEPLAEYPLRAAYAPSDAEAF